jgi:HAE1 family hydrophobic/amphiphilic exporter-1
MSRFFVNRPIVAIVIAIIMTILGLVSMLGLPIAQFPNIVPPVVQVQATYTGADAITVQNSVAVPIEQQVSGVDNMTYMYSTSASNGGMTLQVNFDLATDPNIDQVLTQLRVNTAQAQLPAEVNNTGVTVQKSLSSPLLVVSLYSPDNSRDALFLANYATINLNDALTRVKGIASVTVFGSGQYAMRIWVKPDQLASLGITVPQIINAIQNQNKVNPAGQLGGQPVPPGQEFTYTVGAPGRLKSVDEFKKIVLKANPDGSLVRVGDVARVEMGGQFYNLVGRYNSQPAAVLLLYQLPGSNALAAANGAKALMEVAKKSFPAGVDYRVSLDTTLAVTEGMVEIEKTFVEAIILVILVVFVFLQGFRATLIPLLAVPVSLVATFAVFPALGFSINTVSLFGLVLAIGLVVDDAIVVVEAVEHYIEKGLSPREATLKAMSEVSGPVIAIAMILSSVFLPTIFIPGITGQMYQQFAVTIAVSVLISAFNALTLSPALASLLLRPRKEARGPLGWFFKKFNTGFGHVQSGYVKVCSALMRKTFVALVLFLVLSSGVMWFGKRLPTGFVPNEDQGYFFVNLQLPEAASLQRTNAACTNVEEILKKLPGVQSVTTVSGYSMLSGVQNTYSGFFFVQMFPWSQRNTPQERLSAEFFASTAALLRQVPEGIAIAFPPPAIPGVGNSGGVSFVLEDRTGAGPAFLNANLEKYIAAVNKRPEFSTVYSTALLSVPQIYLDVDRDKVLKQGVQLSDVYQTLQAFMGGYFVNYFNEFGRQWQVYVQAEGEYRNKLEKMDLFYVLNNQGQHVPLSTLLKAENTSGPEFTLRYNLYGSAQINAITKPEYSTDQGMAAMQEVFAETMPPGMGYDYMGMSYQEQQAQQGIQPWVIFMLSLLFVFLILAGLYESWTLPFSVLLSTPIAVCGAFAGLWLRHQRFPFFANNLYAQIGLITLIGLAAKNAILIVEYAKLEYDKGKPLFEATLEGSKLRLRPILMTSFAFILGCVPLAIAMGSGAVSREILGTTVIAGMMGSTGIAIFFIPVGFYVIEKMSGAKPHLKESAEGGPPAPPAEPSTPSPT